MQGSAPQLYTRRLVHTDPRSLARFAVGTAAAACLVILALEFIAVFHAGENVAALTFGTAAAPYSDALGPWLEGGMASLFGLQPPVSLYRPTVGVFWSTILATSDRVDMIPTVFCIWFFVLLAGTLIVERDDPQLMHAVIAWLAITALMFGKTIKTLYIATTNVDLAAFVFTLSGVMLLLTRGAERHDSKMIVGAAALCLGVAAAIRGPMLVAGPFMIALRILASPRPRLARIWISILAFVLPVVIDTLLQHRFAVVNNGIVALFCVYSDEARTWTPGCHEAFLAQRPSAGTVLQAYVTFALSPLGMRLLFIRAAKRAMRDLALLQNGWSLAILLATAGFTVRFNRGDVATMRADQKWGVVTTYWRPLIAFGVVAATLLWARHAYPDHYWSDLLWIVLATCVAASLRLWRVLICLISYLLGLTFLCLAGQLATDRQMATLSFTLYLGVALLLTSHRGLQIPTPVRPWGMQTVAILTVAAICFLYVGNLFMPSKLRTFYRESVYARPGMALKISDDPRIDRSLYYTGDRQIIYTQHDALPIAGVRRYRGLLNRQVGNSSFINPNSFLD